MGNLTPIQPAHRSSTTFSIIALVLSILAVGLAIVGARRAPSDASNGAVGSDAAWKRTLSTRTLRVGVGAFPPYTMIDPSNGDPKKRYSGMAIDMVYYIANSFNPPWAVEFQEINWDTLRADLYSGKCDFVANVMYATIPRLPDFDFTIPYTYMSMGIGIVAKDNDRIVKFDDLNRPEVKISLVQGWTPTDLARSRLPKATLLIRPMDDPAAFQYQELVSGRADIILQDAATATLIKKSHPNEVKLLWTENPPIRYACAFMLRKGDHELRSFLSGAIEAMLVDGTIDALDRKWGGLTDIREYAYRPGSGVQFQDRSK